MAVRGQAQPVTAMAEMLGHRADETDGSFGSGKSIIPGRAVTAFTGIRLEIADNLDALANLFGAHFREDYPEERQGAGKMQEDSLLSYPYERTRAALERLSKSGDLHPSHGWKLRYSNPKTGSDAFPTMAAFLQWLPKGFVGRDYRSTDGAVYCVVEGRGSVDIGAAQYQLAPHDVFVVPSWVVHRFSAATDCVIFSYSDRAAQEALGFWREAVA